MTEEIEAFVKWYAENKALNAKECRDCKRMEEALIAFLKEAGFKSE